MAATPGGSKAAAGQGGWPVDRFQSLVSAVRPRQLRHLIRATCLLLLVALWPPCTPAGWGVRRMWSVLAADAHMLELPGAQTSMLTVEGGQVWVVAGKQPTRSWCIMAGHQGEGCSLLPKSLSALPARLQGQPPGIQIPPTS